MPTWKTTSWLLLGAMTMATTALLGCGGGGEGGGGSNSGTGSRPRKLEPYTINNQLVMLPTGPKIPLPGISNGGQNSSPPLPADLFAQNNNIANVQASSGQKASALMSVPRRDATATTLLTGEVLVAGGADPSTTVATCEIYKPSTGEFALTTNLTGTNKTTQLTVPRQLHTATLLTNGDVVFIGGLDDAFESVKQIERYSATDGTFKSAGVLSKGRFAHSATMLDSGEILIVGGIEKALGANPLAPLQVQGQVFRGWLPMKDVDIWSPASNDVNKNSSLPNSLTAGTQPGHADPLPDRRCFHAATLVPGNPSRVAIFGGIGLNGQGTSTPPPAVNAYNVLNTILVFDPAQNKWNTNAGAVNGQGVTARVFGKALPCNLRTDRNGQALWDVLLVGGAAPVALQPFLISLTAGATTRDDGPVGSLPLQLFQLDPANPNRFLLAKTESFPLPPPAAGQPACPNNNPPALNHLTAPPAAGGNGMVALLLAGGRIFLAGGVIFDPPTTQRIYQNGGYIVRTEPDPAKITLICAGDGAIPAPKNTFSAAKDLTTPRSYALGALTPGVDGRVGNGDDQVLIAGGENNYQVQADAEVYSP